MPAASGCCRAPDDAAVRDLYRQFNIVPIASYSGMKSARGSDDGRVRNNEVLIMNYDQRIAEVKRDEHTPQLL